MLAGAPPPPYGGSLFGPPAISAFNDDEPVELSPLDDGWEVVQEATNNGVLVLTTHCEHPAVARDAAQENFAVLVHAKAPVAAAEASERAPLDLVTVLDVSGSMSGSKLGLLKQAMGFVIDHLGPGDRLSIVAFSCRAHRIIRLTCMTDGGKALARDAVESLTANGSTNIGDGLRVAAEVIDGRRHGNPVSSVILLSDGQDNHTLRQGGDGPFGGAKSYIDLVPRSLRRGTGNGCSTVHTFGFGTDHDAAAMHAIAEVTGGTFSFIQNHAVVQDSFAQCTGGLLSVAVQEARVAVECLQAGVRVRAVRSGRYVSRVDADDRTASVDVGELYADEERHFLLLLDVPRFIKVSCTYRDAANQAVGGRCLRGCRGSEAGGGGRHGAVRGGRAGAVPRGGGRGHRGGAGGGGARRARRGRADTRPSAGGVGGRWPGRRREVRGAGGGAARAERARGEPARVRADGGRVPARRHKLARIHGAALRSGVPRVECGYGGVPPPGAGAPPAAMGTVASSPKPFGPPNGTPPFPYPGIPAPTFEAAYATPAMQGMVKSSKKRREQQRPLVEVFEKLGVSVLN
jgi:hypothetical protein